MSKKMKVLGRIFLLVVCLTALLAAANAVEGRINSFTIIPRGLVAPGTSITYNCQAIGTDVAWFTNDIRRDQSFQDYDITYNFDRHDHTIANITLQTVATVQKNNTMILCYASGSATNQADRRSASIMVAGQPLPPNPSMEIQSNGTVLHIAWKEPFSPVGFNITSYNLTIYNHTSNLSREINTTAQFYNLTKPVYSNTSCHDLTVTVRANNDVGPSVEGTIEGGFPIFPQVEDMFMKVDISFLLNASLRLCIEFPVPVVCSFQLPADYTIAILHESGQIVTSRGPKPANSSTGYVMETFIDELDVNNTYMAILTVSHYNVPGEFVLTKYNIAIPIIILTCPFTNASLTPTAGSNNTCSSTSILLVIVLLALGVTICVMLAVSILALFYRKGKKTAKSEHPVTLTETTMTSDSNAFQLDSPPKGKLKHKAPRSLPPMALNPIYEGPTYDSPGGESLKCLLGSSSIPSTPMTDSPRYFGAPPSLPPPRRLSATTWTNPPPVITEEQIKINGVHNSEYTDMKPVRSRAATFCSVPRPPDVPFAVYEAMGGTFASHPSEKLPKIKDKEDTSMGDEYVTLHK